MEMLAGTKAPVRIWTDVTTVEPDALNQLRRVANLPWTHGVAVMPDVHVGKGATVGSVIAMRQAVSPAAVGVDIGCGVSGVRLSEFSASDLPDDLAPVRTAIEAAVPCPTRSAGCIRCRRYEHRSTGGGCVGQDAATQRDTPVSDPRVAPPPV